MKNGISIQDYGNNLLYGTDDQIGVLEILKACRMHKRDKKQLNCMLKEAGVSKEVRQDILQNIQDSSLSKHDYTFIKIAIQSLLFEWQDTAHASIAYENYIKDVLGDDVYNTLLQNWISYLTEQTNAETIRQQVLEAMDKSSKSTNPQLKSQACGNSSSELPK